MREAICALCGRARKEEDLTCPRCYTLYQKDVVERYRSKKEVLEVVDWVEEKVKEKLAGFQNLKDKLEKKEAEFKALEEEVRKEAFQLFRERTSGKHLPKEILQDLKEETQKEVWQKKKGNRLYAELQGLREDVKEKTAALEETLQRVEEIRKGRRERVSVDELIKSLGIPSSKKP